MSQTAGKIVELCGNNGLQNKINRVINQFELNREEKKEIRKFAESHLVDLYKMGLEYALAADDDHYSAEEKEQMEYEFLNQLNYWWIELQSEWIRYNNLMNYKMVIRGESDPVLEAKGSMCSLFLQPISRYLNGDELRINIQTLQDLLNRSRYDDMYDEYEQGDQSSEQAN